MSLVKCAECGELVSTNAKVCVHCGYNVEDKLCFNCRYICKIKNGYYACAVGLMKINKIFECKACPCYMERTNNEIRELNNLIDWEELINK